MPENNYQPESVSGRVSPPEGQTGRFSAQDMDELRQLMSNTALTRPAAAPLRRMPRRTVVAPPSRVARPRRVPPPAPVPSARAASGEAAAKAVPDQSNLFDWARAMVAAIIFVGLVFSFLARVIGVSGPSMEPTLLDGQKLLISNLFYTPQQGDVIIFSLKDFRVSGVSVPSGDEPLVKRIIATEGQTVDINFLTGDVTVDGKILDEPYILEPIDRQRPDDVGFPFVVPPGHVFVMGDNRNISLDSRSRAIGAVDARRILGHVLLRVWPFGGIG
ncbi:MAG: signal peptidase I [Oscillospiraceae bacterium]|nr:signal peptidase I [Oscillospiraceae bacterium]